MSDIRVQELSVDVAIIGACPAGLTAGYLLTNQGKSVAIIEQDETFGGAIGRTAGHEGYRFDIGDHRFLCNSQQAAIPRREVSEDQAAALNSMRAVPEWIEAKDSPGKGGRKAA